MISFRIVDQPSRPGTLLVLVTLLSLVTQVRSQAAAPLQPQKSTVRGTVINAVTQAPVPRALVLTGDNRVAVLTDGEGHFEITLPDESASVQGGTIVSEGQPQQPWRYVKKGNTYWFMARKPGFLENPEKNRAHASTGDDVTISLIPEAIIKGRISFGAGDAALGITVDLYWRQVQDGLPRWTQRHSVRANSAGEFRFAELAPGSYKLVTREFMDNDPITNIRGSQQFGFPPVYYPGVSDFTAASTIELTAGQEFQADLSLVRQPYYPVKIPLTNADITAGLNISVQGQRGPGYSLGYNPGEQRIEGLLPTGNYVVEAQTWGQNGVNGSVSLRMTGAAVDAPPMTLVPNSSLAIQVKEEFTDTSWNASGTWSDGKSTFELHGPRTYLQASVESADDFAQNRFGSIRPPTGSDDQSLILENLAPGRYWLRLHTSRGYVASALQGNVDVLRQPLTIRSGSTAPIEVKVRDDVAELDGTITALAQHSSLTEDSAEPTQVWVFCVPLSDSSGEFLQFGVSGDGKFSNPRMAPGDYRVLAFSSAQTQLPYRDPEAMKAYESKGPIVHLAAGQKVSVDVPTIASE
jgi:hypothetical protein